MADKSQKDEQPAKGFFSNLFTKAGAMIGIVPILFLVYLGLVPVFKSVFNPSQNMYVLPASGINVRYEPGGCAKSENLLYGDRIKVVDPNYKNSGWVKILYQELDGTNRILFAKKDYLLDKKTFKAFKKVFNTNSAKKQIPATKDRIAILGFVEKARKIDRLSKHLHVYSAPDSILFFAQADLNNDGKYLKKYKKWTNLESAVIMENAKTKKRRLVIFDYDKRNRVDSDTCIYNSEIEGQYIRPIYKREFKRFEGADTLSRYVRYGLEELTVVEPEQDTIPAKQKKDDELESIRLLIWDKEAEIFRSYYPIVEEEE